MSLTVLVHPSRFLRSWTMPLRLWQSVHTSRTMALPSPGGKSSDQPPSFGFCDCAAAMEAIHKMVMSNLVSSCILHFPFTHLGNRQLGIPSQLGSPACS